MLPASLHSLDNLSVMKRVWDALDRRARASASQQPDTDTVTPDTDWFSDTPQTFFFSEPNLWINLMKNGSKNKMCLYFGSVCEKTSQWWKYKQMMQRFRKNPVPKTWIQILTLRACACVSRDGQMNCSLCSPASHPVNAGMDSVPWLEINNSWQTLCRLTPSPLWCF